MDDGMRAGGDVTWHDERLHGKQTSRHMRANDDVAPHASDVLGSKGVVPIFLCLLVSVLVTVLVCVLHVPKYAADCDDFSQALYARGAMFDTPGYLMPYSMVLYSAPLCLLYAALPFVPWYPLTLMGLQVVSFAAMFNLARKVKASTLVRVFALSALALCEFMVTDYLTFSSSAVVAFAAGMSLVLAHGCYSRPRSVDPGAVLGYLLVIMGVSLRYDVCFAATLVFLPFLGWAIVHNRNAGTILMAFGVVACIGLSYVAGQVAWRTGQGWESYVDNQEAAASIADYPRVSYEDVRRVAPKLSENDVDMLYEFLFVDADPYDLETFRAIDSVVQPFGIRTLLEAVRSRVSYTAVVFGLVAVTFACAALLGSARSFGARGKALLFGVCAITLVITLLLFLRARPRMHVVLPLFVTTLFALVVGALNDDPRASAREATARLHAAFPIAGIVAFALIAALVEVKYARPLQRSLSSELTGNAQRYVDAHPDQLVLFLRSQGALENYDAFEFDRWQVPQNAVFIGGGYEYYTTPWENFLKKHDLSREHFLGYLLSDKGMVAINDERHAQMVMTYLEEHTGKSVRAEKIESIGRGTQSSDEYFVWSYSVVSD